MQMNHTSLTVQTKRILKYSEPDTDPWQCFHESSATSELWRSGSRRSWGWEFCHAWRFQWDPTAPGNPHIPREQKQRKWAIATEWREKMTTTVRLYAYICSVDRGRPPQSESSIGDLVQTRSLGIGQLLPFHGLLKTTGFLPTEKK